MSDVSFESLRADVPSVPALDSSQREVLGLGDAESAVVIGAPGSGKTTTLVEVIADRVLTRGWSSDEVLALTGTRGTATRLRDRIATRLERATNGPLARSVNSIAFDIVQNAARAAGAPPQRLLTGSEQDFVVAQLLAGHIEDGGGPAWPEPLGPEVRGLRGFRTELREFMARATEHGIDPDGLRALARDHDHPEWAAAADFVDDYLAVVSSARTDQLDSAELVRFAVAALARGEASEAVSRLRLVLVDDLQEATSSAVSLIRGLAARGVAVVAFGDPDVASNAFRGGEPDIVARLGPLLGIRGVRTIALGTVHRQGPALRAFTGSVVERIGTAGVVGHRGAAAAADDGDAPVVRIDAATPAREWAALALQLREHHLMGGIPWSRMAVVVRGGAQIAGVSRALALADVPTASPGGGRALRDDRAARALLDLVDVAIGRAELTPAVAEKLLAGPFGGLDALTLRRLRLALRAEELAGGGDRPGSVLVAEALGSPGRFATIDNRAARSAARLAETLSAVAELERAGGTVEELLWLAWDRSRLASTWLQQSNGTGIAAAEAGRDLDGMVALFTAAKAFTEREPEPAPRNFLEAVLDAEVPDDTLSPRAIADTVLVTTPSGVVGSEFDVVAVVGLQEGVWPNLRIRGSLLHAGELVEVAVGPGAAVGDDRKQVLADELRLFALAVSRARRQVIVSCVSNDDEAPSVFMALAPDDAVVLDPPVLSALTLRGLTGRLRRELTSATPERFTADAASALARLAREGVPGADPDDWHGLRPFSTTGPLFDDEQPVPVSPSRLEAFESSPLDWFVDLVSGSRSSTAMGLGTIVHWAMETAHDPDVDEIWRGIESRWSELVFESPWIAEQQKRMARRLAAGVAEYLGDFQRDEKQLAGAEQRFELEVGRARVTGMIDRVERSPSGEVVIVDLKTGRPITRQATVDENAQLGAYQLAYASGALDPILEEFGVHRGGGAKLLYVREGVRAKLYREGVQGPLDEEGLERFRDRIRQAAIGMAAASFPGEIELDPYRGFDVPRKSLHRVRSVASD